MPPKFVDSGPPDLGDNSLRLIEPQPAKKKSYDFIDAIRGIAMVGIVAEHAIFLGPTVYNPQDQPSIIMLSTLIQVVKFGTICFFLIAGFLIGENFTNSTALSYLQKRIKNTFLPWLFWSLMFLLVIILGDVNSAFKFGHGHLDNDYGSQILAHIKMVYLYTSYWFIPNFLICISILLIFRYHLYSYLLGAILFLFTAAHTVNIYFEWIEPRHSTAIFGFVFFLWLGAQFNKNLSAIEAWLNKTPVYLWVILMVLSLILGVKEELFLRGMHSIDQYNSLRLSNMFYSLACFFFFLRVKNLKLIQKINPRETTFGIYLIHYIFVYSLLPEIFTSLRHNANNLTLPQVLCYQLARFVIVYGLTYGLVKLLIASSRLKWSIGR